MKDRSHDEAMVDLFRDDPGYADELLSIVLEEGDKEELAIVVRQMAKAFGDLSHLDAT
ncbi:hypothetical protein [Pseudomonas sp. BGI-2]|uniref:hypothetical protein n=1 Tax=Pseudomonas sp. BGI-2 TaxID=2528211 RepID=UPI0013F415F0|nr:hypothetical protein [Pseudomonas sp. BGI-2]